jgi:hypothetical protein
MSAAGPAAPLSTSTARIGEWTSANGKDEQKTQPAYKRMTMSSTAHTARLIAKILANRNTSRDEIPDLIDQVHRGLANLDRPRGRRESAKIKEAIKAAITAKPVSAPKKRGRKKREAAPAESVAESVPLSAEAAPALSSSPTLLRRSEVKENAEIAPATAPSLGGVVRGVVRWFDPQTRRGGLRLQGISSDIPVEPRLLAQCNITRMFKGQEVEARLAGTPEIPQLLEFKLRTAGADAHASSGMVRARQQKPVVVELKREALKRHAARDAAELLLPNRSR